MEMNNFLPLNVTERCKTRGNSKGSLTMICSNKNGKRLIISEELAQILELDGSVQIGFVEDNLVLGKHLPGDGNGFLLKRQGKKPVIYSAELVHAIAEKQQIDFANTVSHTWYNPIMDEYENIPVVLFNPEVDA